MEKFLVFLNGVWLGGGKVKGWKNILFGWEEKWDDGICSFYRFTLMNHAPIK